MTTAYSDLDVQDVESHIANKILEHYRGGHDGFVRVGPKGYFLPNQFKQEAANIYNMEIRPTDIFVASYPRSGTTWTQELVWMIANDLDYATSEAIPLSDRFPFLEHSIVASPTIANAIQNKNEVSEHKLKLLKWVTQGAEQLKQITTQRFVKTHLPMSLLPPILLDTAKAVYVARDPRDVVVSLYYFNKNIQARRYIGDFKTFWNLFIQDLQYWSPYFEHLKEAWAKRHHPNMLFLFYEEISKDLAATVRRVAKFLNKELSEGQVVQLCEHLRIDNFKNNQSINYMFSIIKELTMTTDSDKLNKDFVRNGKAGGWRDNFDDEMAAEAEQWIADNLRDTDLRFPNFQQ